MTLLLSWSFIFQWNCGAPGDFPLFGSPLVLLLAPLFYDTLPTAPNIPGIDHFEIDNRKDENREILAEIWD